MARQDPVQDFITAAINGQTATVELILRKHPSLVNATNNDGNTALILAAMGGNTASVELLLQNSANKDAINKYGHTALMLAAQYGHKETVQMLLTRDSAIDIDAKDKKGETALAKATCNGHREITRTLAEKGATIQCNGRYLLNVLPKKVARQLELYRLALNRGTYIRYDPNITESLMDDVLEQDHNFEILPLEEHRILYKIEGKKVLICNSGDGVSEHHHKSADGKYLTGQYFNLKGNNTNAALAKVLRPTEKYASAEKFYVALEEITEAETEEITEAETEEITEAETETEAKVNKHRFQAQQKGPNCTMEAVFAALKAQCIANDPKEGHIEYIEKRIQWLEGAQKCEIKYQEKLTELKQLGTDAKQSEAARLGIDVDFLDDAIRAEKLESEAVSRLIENKRASRVAKIYHSELYKKSTPQATVQIMAKNCIVKALRKKLNKKDLKEYTYGAILCSTIDVSEYYINGPLKDFSEEEVKAL
jgi:hypothetical protein